MPNIALKRLGRRIRLGIVGGAEPSLIGPVHREAARLDDLFSLEACVLSSRPEKCAAAARELGIPRAYATTQEMFRAENARGDGIDAVAIVTPNDSHFRILGEALDAGIHAICDKPLTTTISEALQIRDRARTANKVVVLTQNYSGYPMVRQAKAMVADGVIGNVHQIHGVYVVGQMGRIFETDDSNVAPSMRWRMDPDRGGESHVLIDIGTHIHHLASYISGLHVAEVMADLGSAVPGRRVHDSANILLRYSNGCFGVFWVTKTASGASKLEIELYGERGGLYWEQSNANVLVNFRPDEPAQNIARQSAAILPFARRAMRGPGIHFVEGFREAFANIYADFADLVVAAISGSEPDRYAAEVPGVIDGLRSLAFVDACIASSKNRTWRPVSTY